MKKLLGIVVLGFLLTNCAPGLFTNEELTLETSDGRSYSYRHNEYFYGKNNFGQCKLDDYWYDMASNSYAHKSDYKKNTTIPQFAVTDCFVKLKPHKLCLAWDRVYAKYDDAEIVERLRNSIADALIIKKEDPLTCRNTSQDNLVDAKRKIDKAKSNADYLLPVETKTQKCTKVKTIRADGHVYWKKVCN